jgi:CheY-like chemotaxis protein
MKMSDLNIVIVEDDQHDFEFLSRALNEIDMSLKITWLKDGEEATDHLEKLAIAGTKSSTKNLFFVDVNLPKVNGLELVKIIKNHRTAKDNYVIMLSGSNTKADMETAKKNGSDSYLEKPLGREQIREFREFLSLKLSSFI